MFFDRFRPVNPLATILVQIHATLARVARDTAYTLAEVHRLKEEVMARLDDLNDRSDPDSDSQPDGQADGQDGQPEPTNPADNPNEPRQG